MYVLYSLDGVELTTPIGSCTWNRGTADPGGRKRPCRFLQCPNGARGRRQVEALRGLIPPTNAASWWNGWVWDFCQPAWSSGETP